jgi:hypothetical protein
MSNKHNAHFEKQQQGPTPTHPSIGNNDDDDPSPPGIGRVTTNNEASA